MPGKLLQRLGVLTVYIPVLLTFLLGPGLEVGMTAIIFALLELAISSPEVTGDADIEVHLNCANVCFLLSGCLQS